MFLLNPDVSYDNKTHKEFTSHYVPIKSKSCSEVEDSIIIYI